jgi:hypothetical protein
MSVVLFISAWSIYSYSWGSGVSRLGRPEYLHHQLTVLRSTLFRTINLSSVASHPRDLTRPPNYRNAQQITNVKSVAAPAP